MRCQANAGGTEKVRRHIDSALSERGRVVVDGMRRGDAVRWAAAALGEPRRLTTPGGLVWAESAGEDWAGCENFLGNVLGYQGESGRIDNGPRQILFTIFKQRFRF
jgi:hypothetical protein